MLAIGLTLALRALVISLATFIIGIGWALVYTIGRKTRSGHVVPQSPTWVSALFMTGIMLVDVGLVWSNWERLTSPVVLPGTALIILGLAAKAATVLIVAVRMSRE